ncbi:MAG: Re/Si-specific NAD(P)(+) transhydrogenase subunit alpha [Actinomycetaceae bacterium]|nr:Re/Si-specific NAD(P)(+) transhydrogenase subunit alpha [Actinomycetaceae bacterium]
MRIGVPKEPLEGQTLVATTPDTAGKLIKLGYEVVVETGAGALADFPDDQYREAGAQVVGPAEAWQADIVVTLDAPPEEQIAQLRTDSVLISRLSPRANPELNERLNKQGVTALAMDAVPRISRAQSMDVLSSMANIAGYRAVIEAASVFGRLFTGQVTAAGKMPPANVYIIGAGVAGLAAIGTANSMGAVVKATDVRDAAAEQVESMGASFVAIPAPAQESSDGYAREMDAEQEKAALKLYAEMSATSDIVITTAQIPGRPAPRLITADAVKAMKPGSVIVDMAASSGGNCELTRPGEVYTTEGGVTIIGHTELAGRLPAQSSQMYGQNIVNLLKLMTPEKDGELTVDLDDEIVRGICVCRAGEILWPPPPVSVAATPAPVEEAVSAVPATPAEPKKSRMGLWLGVAAILAGALVLFSPAAVASYYTVLALAVVVGFYVITAVTHSLHTPLMSETNAISGIILVGSILQVGSTNLVVSGLSFIAIVIASINIFGGFFVTHRMLDMFRRD